MHYFRFLSFSSFLWNMCYKFCSDLVVFGITFLFEHFFCSSFSQKVNQLWWLAKIRIQFWKSQNALSQKLFILFLIYVSKCQYYAIELSLQLFPHSFVTGLLKYIRFYFFVVRKTKLSWQNIHANPRNSSTKIMNYCWVFSLLTSINGKPFLFVSRYFRWSVYFCLKF